MLWLTSIRDGRAVKMTVDTPCSVYEVVGLQDLSGKLTAKEMAVSGCLEAPVCI